MHVSVLYSVAFQTACKAHGNRVTRRKEVTSQPFVPYLLEGAFLFSLFAPKLEVISFWTRLPLQVDVTDYLPGISRNKKEPMKLSKSTAVGSAYSANISLLLACK